MRWSPSVTPLVENDKPFGLLLAGDYAAEHEFGITNLTRLIQADETAAVGIARRSAHSGWNSNEAVLRGETGYRVRGSRKKRSATYLLVRDGAAQHDPESLISDLKNCGRDEVPFTGGWNRQGFFVMAYTPESRAILTALYEAILRKDVAVWLGGAPNNPFSRPGLVITIPTAVPDHHLVSMAEADGEQDRLQAAVDATGIVERLRVAQKGYYALKPRWTEIAPRSNDGTPMATAHPVVFFLNPREQTRCEFGWFTVEDLDAWINGSGPIMKKTA